MKRIIASVAGLVSCFMGIGWFLGAAQGEPGAATPAAGPEAAFKVGLIDLERVFHEYKKFEALQEDLKEELGGQEQKIKAIVEKLKALDAELKSGTFKEDSPEFREREEEGTRLATEYQQMQRIGERELGRNQAKMYHQVYLEVLDAVQKFSTHYKYSLVIKFTKSDLSSTDPAKVRSALQQNVIYYRTEDDLTDDIVAFLNKKYTAGTKTRTTTPSKTASPPKVEAKRNGGAARN